MNISFGRKIQIATGQILDRKHDRFIPVTCYEYDCKDLFDVQEVKFLEKDFIYSNVLSHNMNSKFHDISLKRENHQRFFNIETNNGDVLALAQAESSMDGLDVKFIESKKGQRHKYLGQVLLSSLGQSVLKENKTKLGIVTAVQSATDYYKNVCGFREMPYHCYEMRKGEISEFIKRTETKTKSPTII